MLSPIGTPDNHPEVKKEAFIGVLPKTSVIDEKYNNSNKTPSAKIVRREWDKERPEKVTFERLIQYYDRTPQIQMPVGMYSEMISGTDMEITCKNEDATNKLNEWVRRTNFYEKFENMITTWLICGNAILEKLDTRDIQDVAEVDMSTIVSKKRDEFGELEYYEHRTWGGKTDKLGEGNTEKFIEFNLSPYSRKPWSNSLFHSLAIPRTLGDRVMAPICEIIWGVEDAIGGIILNNAYPITTITYAGADDEYLKKEARRWRDYKPGDKRVQKIKPEIEFFETKQGDKYTDYLDWLRKTVEMGVQFPNDILTGDFTSRASSETTESIVQKKVRGYQRYLSNKLKNELFDVILDQVGFNAEEEECKVSFTTQNVIELEVQQVKELGDTGVMTKMEQRDWLRKNAGIDLPDDDKIKADEEMEKTIAQNAQDIKKANDNQKNERFFKLKECKCRCGACKEGQHVFCTGKRGKH